MKTNSGLETVACKLGQMTSQISCLAGKNNDELPKTAKKRAGQGNWTGFVTYA